MPTLLLHFPARRYHATPYGHHVNEGLVEWPPSPWRLLRALLSVGYCTQGWPATFGDPRLSAPPDVARSLILKLADVLPSYYLPSAVGAHTRHYMPVGKFDGDRERTTLVFDTWAQIEDGELGICWEAALTSDETRLLGVLMSHLGYLGRSESWVNARLLRDSDSVEQIVVNCRPCSNEPSPGPGWEQVTVVAPEPPEAFAHWRQQQLAALLADIPPLASSAGRQTSAKERKAIANREAARRSAAAAYPVDVIACLQSDTTSLREHGWSQPPGSRRVLYWRRSNALRAQPLEGQNGRFRGESASFMLLSLKSASGNDHALPPMTRSLHQGEMLHRQAVAARARIPDAGYSPALTGCDEAGQPLQGRHGHAHLLSLDLDADDHIDHLLVWAPDGLSASDQRALRTLRDTHTKGGVGPLRLAVAAIGSRADLSHLPTPFHDALTRAIGSSREWQSVTPFVPPRHLKPRGSNSLEGQLTAELASRGLPPPAVVQWLDPQSNEHARRLRHHVRVRRGGKPPPVNVGFALRLIFETPVAGPLCLGYGSHYGLGRFECSQGAA